MTVSPMFDPDDLIRPDIADLTPYTPILPFEVLSRQLGRQPEEIIKLDANENPYGPSPRVAEALAAASYLHIYPDPESRDLRQALADYTGLSADYLLAGHGADELIDLIIRLFVQPGDGIINCPPTFGMYAFDGDINGADVIEIQRRPDFSIDVAAIEAVWLSSSENDSRVSQPHLHPGGGMDSPQIKLIFVTSPNNPDGSLLRDDELKRLLALPVIVVLDEAYVEFSGGSRIHWVRDYNNLIVLRTFSKWAGLAGLRVGYGAFPPGIIRHLWKIKQPYNVNLAGQIAAQVSLAEQSWLLANVERLIQERNSFYRTLAEFAWLSPYPSHANFVLCKVEGRSAAMVKQQLTDHGILVRYYDSPGLSDHLRFSIGTPAQMARLREVLREI